MQIAAMTSHAALTASPRLSATMANETAPRRATAIHKTFVCGALELLMKLMGRSPARQATPRKTSFILAPTLIKIKSVAAKKIYTVTMSEKDTWRKACWRLHRSPPRRGHRDDGTENRAAL